VHASGVVRKEILMGNEWGMKERAPQISQIFLLCTLKFKFTLAKEKNYKIICVPMLRLQNIGWELKKNF
jgi:hypothetical protein